MSDIQGGPEPAFEFCPAKINLYLGVTNRRADGYHELDSLAVFAAAGDRLWVEPSGPALTISGPFAAQIESGPENLVARAANRFAELTDSHVPPLHLEKTLPVASGIGGGSADAAATLRLLARLSGMPVPPELPRELGADVPVCLASRPVRMSGIGDRLGPAPALPPFGLVLVNPGIGLATQAVFRAREGKFSREAELPASWSHVAAMAADLAALTNDLQQAAIALCPVIADVLARLAETDGVMLPRMSGSGATCFGLTDTPAEAERAAAVLRRQGWWTWGGPPFTPPPPTQ